MRRQEIMMATEITYPHVEKQPNQPACLARLPRIRVAQIVMDYLAHGWSVDEICRQHGYLLPAEVHSAMAYYFDHRTAMDAEIEQELSAVEDARRQLPESPIAARLRAQRKR
jgi:uncharacterized protein (DUF433 family)